MKESVKSAAELPAALARDKKFRKQLLAAIGHAESARQHAVSRTGLIATAKQLAGDDQFRDELRAAGEGIREAWSRVEKERSHRQRNTLLLVAGAGAATAAALPQSRRWLSERLETLNFASMSKARVIEKAIEVNAPLSTVYNQWTQFESFPTFMDGIDHVRQEGDTRLHWVADIGGERREWDAEITEQHPEERVAWKALDQPGPNGVVTFHKLEPGRTKVMVQMEYDPEGMKETVGSALGFDSHRVQGDLKSFKDFIESRSHETGAWRGEVERT